MAWSVSWRVTIDGSDVSSAMRPYLTDISVVDRSGTSSDSCSLAFDDADGALKLPNPGSKIEVRLNGVLVFQGVVDSTPWELTRGGGRILRVTAKGFDTRGKAKEGQLWHLDDASLGDALKKAGRSAGVPDVIIDPAFASMQRDYWSPDGASFLAWGEKLAREMGATFKIRDGRAVFAKRGQGLAATGEAMPTITAAIGRNVIAVRIDPTQGRRQFAKAQVRYFDRDAADWKVKDVEIGTEGTNAANLRRFTAADEDEAEAVGQGRKSDSEREGANGTIEMDLEPTAQAGAKVILTGARPGIDGQYEIDGVTHKADRGGGSTTSLDVKQPENGAGRDTRTATAGSVPTNVPVPTPRPN